MNQKQANQFYGSLAIMGAFYIAMVLKDGNYKDVFIYLLPTLMFTVAYFVTRQKKDEENEESSEELKNEELKEKDGSISNQDAKTNITTDASINTSITSANPINNQSIAPEKNLQ